MPNNETKTPAQQLEKIADFLRKYEEWYVTNNYPEGPGSNPPTPPPPPPPSGSFEQP